MSVRAALQNAQRVVVLEKSLAVGIGGILSTDVRMAMSGQGSSCAATTVVAGLGGRGRSPQVLARPVAAQGVCAANSATSAS